jgi:hypothetical protein
LIDVPPFAYLKDVLLRPTTRRRIRTISSINSRLAAGQRPSARPPSDRRLAIKVGLTSQSDGVRRRYAAFRAAQLARLAVARQEAENGTGHPFFWAGSIYVGDPGDLNCA